MKCCRVYFKLFYTSGEKDILILHILQGGAFCRRPLLEDARVIPLNTCPVIQQLSNTDKTYKRPKRDGSVINVFKIHYTHTHTHTVDEVKEVIGHTVLKMSGQKLGPIFLHAFAKLRKATISFVMYVCPSVRMEQLASHWTDCHEILYMGIFQRCIKKNPSLTL